MKTFVSWGLCFFVGLVAILYWCYTMAGAIFICEHVGIQYPYYLIVACFAPFLPPIAFIIVLDWLYWHTVVDDDF